MINLTILSSAIQQNYKSNVCSIELTSILKKLPYIQQKKCNPKHFFVLQKSQSQPEKSGVKPTLAAETAGSWPKASSVLAIGGGDTQQAAQAPRAGAGKRGAIMQNNKQLLDEPQNPLKDLTHASHVDPLKQHNANAIKLVQIGECPSLPLYTLSTYVPCVGTFDTRVR